MCKQGEEVQRDPTVSSDRLCRSCVEGLTYQDEINGDSCKSVSSCPGDYSEVSVPTLFQDRLCSAPSSSTFLASTTGIASVAGACAGVFLLLVLIVVVVLRRRHRGDSASFAGTPPGGGKGATAFENPMYEADGGGLAGDEADAEHGGYADVSGLDEPGYLDVSDVPGSTGGGGGNENDGGYLDVRGQP